MKKTYLLVLLLSFLVVYSPAIAQNKKDTGKKDTKGKTDSKKKKRIKSEDEETGDKYFEIEEYFQAAQFYEKVAKVEPQNEDVAIRLAESYELMFNYKKAEEWYKKASEINSPDYPLAGYKYAAMLKTNGKYEEAKAAFEKFISSYNPPAGATTPDHFKEQAALEMNGAALAIDEMKKPQRDYNFKVLKRPVNSQNSDYAPCIADHDSSIIVTSAREGATGGETYNKFGEAFSDMYRLVKKDGDTWVKTVDKTDFEIVLNTEFNDASGSFSKDKKRYYFTSCKEADKKGSSDAECAIYFSELKDGKWTKAVRLNENVNAIGSWNAQPSVNDTGDTLFFVSKRTGGKGMHDIWFCTAKPNTNDWSAAKNLDKVNTPFIDMSPCYHDSLHTLFFASNGHEGFGGLDLLMARGTNFETIRNLGLPFNSNLDDFYMVAGKTKGYLASNREGGLGNDDIYMFNLQSKQTIITLTDQDSVGVASSVSITGEVFYRFNHLPAEGVEIALLDENGNIVKKVKTNENGEFRFENLPGIAGYKVLLDENDPNLTVNAKYEVENVAMRKSDKAPSRVLFENIYFDFDKAELRPEAKKVLDELVAYYNKNKDKNIQIELVANTDNFGANEYNQALSTERGNAAQAYLMKKGVNRSALTVAPKGEDNPVETNDNAAGRQLNRRVEFYIIGGEGVETKAMTYIIEPKTDIYTVAKKFNMSVDEIKALNGLSGEDLLAFRPLRVRRTGDKDLYAPISSASYQLSKDEEMKLVPDYSVQQGVSTGRKKSGRRMSGGSTSGGKVAATPQEGYHIVEPLNTMYSIAKQYNITLADLKSWNGLGDNTNLQIGQKLKVSASAGAATDAGSSSANTTSASAGNTGQSSGGDEVDAEGKYKVREGDTMYSIAKKFGLTVEELMQMNGLENFSLYKSMRLKVKK